METNKMMKELCALIARHCHRDFTSTPIPEVILSRSPVKTEPVAAIYHPLLCVVARGRKRIFLGDEVFDYDPATYLICSVDLPVTGQVIEAPSLGLTLTLNPRLLATLLLDLPPSAARQGASKAMEVNALEADLLDPLVRLLRLLDEPAHLPTLAPLIEREIHYRLLLGQRGAMLRQLARPASQLSQIGRTIQSIRQRYAQPLPIDELARLAGMSAPSYHRHFRAVTSMSPLQFQKKLRLQEARRRLLSEDVDASRVGFDVGYESASQFSREYRRLFGTPPSRDQAQTHSASTSQQRRPASPPISLR
jgi:AraC-like DNA-binding protein